MVGGAAGRSAEGDFEPRDSERSRQMPPRRRLASPLRACRLAVLPAVAPYRRCAEEPGAAATIWLPAHSVLQAESQGPLPLPPLRPPTNRRLRLSAPPAPDLGLTTPSPEALRQGPPRTASAWADALLPPPLPPLPPPAAAHGGAHPSFRASQGPRQQVHPAVRPPDGGRRLSSNPFPPDHARAPSQLSLAPGCGRGTPPLLAVTPEHRQTTPPLFPDRSEMRAEEPVRLRSWCGGESGERPPRPAQPLPAPAAFPRAPHSAPPAYRGAHPEPKWRRRGEAAQGAAAAWELRAGPPAVASAVQAPAAGRSSAQQPPPPAAMTRRRRWRAQG